MFKLLDKIHEGVSPECEGRGGFLRLSNHTHLLCQAFIPPVSPLTSYRRFNGSPLLSLKIVGNSLFISSLVSDVNHILINSTRLLFQLQNIAILNQSLSGCLEPKAIASQITNGLVDGFNCSFSRIWLVEADRLALKLVASSGLYTRLDGDFALVPMGAYKVGKIAQKCIPFLSNQLAEETWVKDRQWAIANSICGFAGLPLAIVGEAIGVLAVFSHQPMEAEFLEALRVLCSSVAVALNNAQLYQQEITGRSRAKNLGLWTNKPLCEQISVILTNIPLTLVGKEHPLTIYGNYILLKTAEVLQANRCNYCRLTYKSDRLYLEAMLSNSDLHKKTAFGEISAAITGMGGKLSIDANNNIIQVQLSLPYCHQPKITASLSHREQEIIQLLAKGMRDREIAQKLFISDRTVKFHVNNVVNKLNSRTRIQAIHQAYSQGYLSQNLN